jgi:hypothetical protein
MTVAHKRQQAEPRKPQVAFADFRKALERAVEQAFAQGYLTQVSLTERLQRAYAERERLCDACGEYRPTVCRTETVCPETGYRAVDYVCDECAGGVQ